MHPSIHPYIQVALDSKCEHATSQNIAKNTLEEYYIETYLIEELQNFCNPFFWYSEKTEAISTRYVLSRKMKLRRRWQSWWWDSFLLLMEEILHQLRLVYSLSHYLQGFIHPRWCRISSINSFILFPFCMSQFLKSKNRQKIIDWSCPSLGEKLMKYRWATWMSDP